GLLSTQLTSAAAGSSRYPAAQDEERSARESRAERLCVGRTAPHVRPAQFTELQMARKAIVGEKVGMTQVWDDAQRAIPVTVVRVSPVRVVQVKTPERDGYSALQVTYGMQKPSRLSKPEAGHFAKASVEPGKRLVELRLEDTSEYTVGQELNADLLEVGDFVDVTAVSKGKGFAG